MLGKYQGADAYEHNQCRQGNRAFVCCQHLAAMLAFVQASLGDKDGIVVALTEDERCQYHIHQIELYAQYCHDAQNPYPADGHGQECQQSQFEVPEREPQEQEDDESTGPSHIVEIIRQITG